MSSFWSSNGTEVGQEMDQRCCYAKLMYRNQENSFLEAPNQNPNITTPLSMADIGSSFFG
jgi:hypothetical protein